MLEKNVDVGSFEELVHRLEHIEFEQFDSDIRANVLAELSRLKRNLVAILSFLAKCQAQQQADSPQFSEAMSTVRQQCIDLNMAISRLQILYFFHIQNLAAAPSEVIRGPYQHLADGLRLVYQLSAPQLSLQLNGAL